MTDNLDRLGLPLLIAVVAVIGVVLGYAAFAPGPVRVIPTISPTPIPAGTGWIGTAPTTRPAPTIRQRLPEPTRVRPTRPPQTAQERRTRAPGTPSHTPSLTARTSAPTTPAPEPTTTPTRNPEPSPSPEPLATREPALTATVEATP